jgi:C4-dicarboxylate transporter DctM subunit
MLTAFPLALMFLGFPVFFILLASATIILIFFMDVPTTVLHQVMFGSVDSFALISVPFFLFAGEIMGVGGMSDRIIRFVLAVMGNVQGCRGLATVGACTVFGAISGSAAATIAAVGRLMYPSLREKYDVKFASGLVCATGAIDILIPPSIGMILYGAAAEQSVAQLFIAGIGPGLLLAAFQAAYVVYYARRHGILDGEPFSWAKVARLARSGFWSLGAPVVILGGIYGGVFSPTEAAGIACVYGIVITWFIYGDITWRQLWNVAGTSMFLTAQILIIVAAAGVFSWVLTVTGIPQQTVEIIQSVATSQWEVLLILNIFLLLVGIFIDPPPALLVLTPLLVPICKAYDIDLVHFGIVMLMNLAIGMFSPPFGLNIFVTQALTRVPLDKLFVGLVPYLVNAIGALVVVTYVPWLSLYLVRLM